MAKRVKTTLVDLLRDFLCLAAFAAGSSALHAAGFGLSL